MTLRIATRTALMFLAVALGVGGMEPIADAAQPPAPAPPRTARESAPVDPTGIWESVVTEDWRWRMIVAKPGDTTSIPYNENGIKVAKEWDPAKDAAAGEHCKAFGPGGVMRLPLRVRVSWADNQTLKIETEAGQQTRLFAFLPPQPPARGPQPVMQPLQPGPQAAASLQGTTVARWNVNTLESVTNNTTGGYLRRNGVPYSANAVIREYFNVHTDFGRQWLSVTTVVDDPTYLRQLFLTSSSFRKVADRDAKWAPFPCEQL